MTRPLLSLAAAALLSSGCAHVVVEPPAEPVRTALVPELQAVTAPFAPVNIRVELSSLPDTERQALAKIIQAARVMDPLFLRQAWAGNETLLLSLVEDTSPAGRERLHAFLLNKGPWYRLEHNAPFLPGVPAKPAAGNFYPAGRHQGGSSRRG